MKQKFKVYLLALVCNFNFLSSSEKWHSEKAQPVEVEIPKFDLDFSMSQLANPWKDSKVICTEKFPLMGKQMGVVETIGIEPIGYELDGQVKVFHLVAQPLEKLIVDEKSPDLEKVIPEINKIVGTHMSPRYQRVKCWGYNGSSPGPTLEATEGDRVRIVLKNELPEPTSIHWHGFEIPNQEDGATPETAKPVLPGQTFTYEFTLYQNGTLLYHSGYNVTKQDLYGLSGFFVVHPKKIEKKYDREIAIMLREWMIPPGGEYPNLMSDTFNWFTFNGFAAPSIPVIKLKQDEEVLIRFGNLGMMSHPIHIHGYRWTLVGTEGGRIQPSARYQLATIDVAPGTTRDVDFKAWNPGIWRLHCHKLHHIMNMMIDVPMGIMAHGGMFTLIDVEPKDPKAQWSHPAQAHDQQLYKVQPGKDTDQEGKAQKLSPSKVLSKDVSFHEVSPHKVSPQLVTPHEARPYQVSQ